MQYGNDLERWEQHIWATMPPPATGCLLVANPFMQDPNFRRSVVLLVNHSATEGTLGFVLNQPLEAQVGDLVDSLAGLAAPLLLGGPVALDTQHYIHSQPAQVPDSQTVAPGIGWAGDFDWLQQQAALGLLQPNDYKFFLGYSGWAPGQLAKEQQERSWLVCPATPQLVFHTHPDHCWQHTIQHMGGQAALMAHFPEEPALN